MNVKSRQILVRFALVAAALVAGAPVAHAGPGGGTYYANSPLLRKFVDSLPGLGLPGCEKTNTCGANNLGQYIPVATADTVTYPGSDYYEIALRDYSEQMHSDIVNADGTPHPTKLRGYVQINKGTDGNNLNTIDPHPIHYLGPLIVATKDRPVRIKFINQLGQGAAGNSFIPVDRTIMGASTGPNSWTWDPLLNKFVSTGVTEEYTENRAELHLHGGFPPWISDGTPHQWITPAGDPTSYKWGVSVFNAPDMANSNGESGYDKVVQGEQMYYYTNAQSSRLMFYHDHALGLTRLNAYAGEAAGYLVRDAVESALEQNGTLPGFAYNLPLVIQDKTFVPDDIAIQDSLWDTTKYGAPGDLWFPHVYETNQDPTQPGGMSPTGRWDYGPWFWPPALVNFPPTNSGTVATLPQPSAVPEGFMDTALVNGTAYPFVEVERRRYRLRILNACNDRTLNLQLYKADPASGGTEVKMITSPDSRFGGVPDPALAGPAFINIATEAGFLTKPYVLNQPAPSTTPLPGLAVSEADLTPSTKLYIDYDKDPRSITINNILNTNLLLGPAQRADIIVDFSELPDGTKLILYNDAPAPAPAGDSRVDYFTNDGDHSASGGAPNTDPGFGPNTRTIMQFRVKGAAPAGDIGHLHTLARLADPSPSSTTGLAAAFATGLEPLLFVPGSPESLANNSTQYLTDKTGKKLPLYRKAIQELFDPDYGRMNSLLGTELQWTNGQNQNTNFNYYTDIPTEVLVDGQPQAWMIVHNGVDTHYIHFHLVNVQVLGRVDWAGVVKAPLADEQGWRETVRMDPLEQTIVAMLPKPAPVPAAWPALPRSVRPLNVTMPATAALGVPYNAASNPNPTMDYGYEYVWHCHLLGHEENDMMRSLVFQVPTAAPLAPTGLAATPNTTTRAIDLAWVVNQNVVDEIAFKIERAEAPGGVAGAFAQLKDGSGLDAVVYYVHNIPQQFFLTGQPNWPAPSYTDTTAVPGVTYAYRVRAYNNAGSSLSNEAQGTLVVASPAAAVALTASKTSPAVRGGIVTFAATGWFDVAKTSPCDASCQFRFSLDSGAGFVVVQNYGVGTSWNMPGTTPAGSYTVLVEVRTSAGGPVDVSTSMPFILRQPAATSVAITAVPFDQVKPGTPVVLTATAKGSTGYLYQFSRSADAGGTWTVIRPWATSNTYSMPTDGLGGASYVLKAEVTTYQPAGADRSATTTISVAFPAAQTLTLLPNVASPQPVGASVTLTATATGSANYQFRFWVSTNGGASYTMLRDWNALNTWTVDTSVGGNFVFMADVRTKTSGGRELLATLPYVIASPVATGVTLTPSVASPALQNSVVTLTAQGSSTVAGLTYYYKFSRSADAGRTYTVVRDYSTNNVLTVDTSAIGTYRYQVDVVTTLGLYRQATAGLNYTINPPAPKSVTLGVSPASPQPVNTVVVFTAAATSDTAGLTFEYRFLISADGGLTYTVKQPYSTLNTWIMPTTAAGSYRVMVDTRTQGSTVSRSAYATRAFVVSP